MWAVVLHKYPFHDEIFIPWLRERKKAKKDEDKPKAKAEPSEKA